MRNPDRRTQALKPPNPRKNGERPARHVARVRDGIKPSKK
jgi:hypothetical protein